jgi:chromosome segregation ATPase
MRQSDSARGMSKTGGAKKGSSRQAGSSRENRDQETEPEGVEADIARLRQEAEQLRKALASEQDRARQLEAAHTTVAERLGKAIASIKQLLERQG